MDQQLPTLQTLILLKYMSLISTPKLVATYSETRARKKKILKLSTVSSWIWCHIHPVTYLLSFEKLKHIISLQEISAITTINCHKSPFIHPTNLCLFDLLAKIQKDPTHQSLLLKTPFMQVLSPSWCLTLGEKVILLKLEGVNWSNDGQNWGNRKYDIPHITYPWPTQQQWCLEPCLCFCWSHLSPHPMNTLFDNIKSLPFTVPLRSQFRAQPWK